MTTRSAYLKSLIALPSRKNSGLETTSNFEDELFFFKFFSTSSPVQNRDGRFCDNYFILIYIFRNNICYRINIFF